MIEYQGRLPTLVEESEQASAREFEDSRNPTEARKLVDDWRNWRLRYLFATRRYVESSRTSLGRSAQRSRMSQIFTAAC